MLCCLLFRACCRCALEKRQYACDCFVFREMAAEKPPDFSVFLFVTSRPFPGSRLCGHRQPTRSSAVFQSRSLLAWAPEGFMFQVRGRRKRESLGALLQMGPTPPRPIFASFASDCPRPAVDLASGLLLCKPGVSQLIRGLLLVGATVTRSDATGQVCVPVTQYLNRNEQLRIDILVT